LLTRFQTQDTRTALNNPVSDRGCWSGGWDNLVVQGRADPQREILDVESVAGHLLPAGGVFACLAAHRRELFPDDMFADLFPNGGAARRSRRM
jgi:hypothetical protein